VLRWFGEDGVNVDVSLGEDHCGGSLTITEKWMISSSPGAVTPSNAAAAAENKPVYSVPDYWRSNTNGDNKTYENEDTIVIFLPAIRHPSLLSSSSAIFKYMEKSGPEL
jgi:hypothetical protein